MTAPRQSSAPLPSSSTVPCATTSPPGRPGSTDPSPTDADGVPGLPPARDPAVFGVAQADNASPAYTLTAAMAMKRRRFMIVECRRRRIRLTFQSGGRRVYREGMRAGLLLLSRRDETS